ncbi:MAG TPA: hypothetical protein VF469_08825 [Kofleriaceae bacterium]
MALEHEHGGRATGLERDQIGAARLVGDLHRELGQLVRELVRPEPVCPMVWP